MRLLTTHLVACENLVSLEELAYELRQISNCIQNNSFSDDYVQFRYAVSDRMIMLAAHTAWHTETKVDPYIFQILEEVAQHLIQY